MNEQKSVIYVVDDDLLICRELSSLLKSQGFKVESFIRASDFLSFTYYNLPSCLLLDVQLPDIDGLTLQKEMERRGIFIPIVFITGHGDIPMSVQGMKAGAIDFLPKPFTDKDLLSAATQAIEKNRIYKKEQAEITLIKERIKTLSPRELEVFQLVARGMLSKQIAFKRGTSLQTIKVHRGRVMQKMQAQTVTELIYFAQKAGITSSYA